MREHEYKPADDSGRCFCLHCGALKHDRILVTCNDRATPGGKLMPEPKRREYASESWDAIGARLAELRRERDAVNASLAEAGPVMTADEQDFCCG